MQYFTSNMTADAVKARYRDLAKTYHPDLNPATKDECTRIMADINSEYEIAVKLAYRAESGDKYSVSVENAIVDLAPIISEIVVLEGIEIEVCGSWIWVGGDTKPVRHVLMDLGFKFSGPKVKWYYASGIKGKRRGHYNMDQIRAKYGSEKVQNQSRVQIG